MISVFNSERLSSLISLVVAIIVLFASYFQWWDITYNGKMMTKMWVKALFALCVALLITAAVLLFK